MQERRPVEESEIDVEESSPTYHVEERLESRSCVFSESMEMLMSRFETRIGNV